MRHLLIAILMLALHSTTLAQSTRKPSSNRPANVPTSRQGGDTIDDAIVIPYLLFSDTGTTTGYSDDYDAVCPYDGSTSPDVVYVYHANPSIYPCAYASIDLCNSSYDTKLYVFDGQMNLVACNDDFYYGGDCWPYSSRIEMAYLAQDETYYIVVDGYGGEHGEYALDIAEYSIGYLTCSPDFWEDGEPPLQDDVPDTYNSGCDGDGNTPAILQLPAGANGTVDVCGRMGWTTVNGVVRPDTDWMSLIVGATGEVDGVIEDNLGGMVRIIAPSDCDNLQVLQTLQLVMLIENPFTITGSPGDEVWIQVDTSHEDPFCGGVTPQEWHYRMSLAGLQSAVPVKAVSWSEVKAMYHR